MGHHLPAIAGSREVLLPLFDRGYLQPQGRGLGSPRSRERRKRSSGTTEKRDALKMLASASGVALGQCCADEIGDVADQNV